MTFDFTLAALVNAGSGVLDLLLTAFVATVRPRQRVHTWFIVFGLAFGLNWLFVNLFIPDDALGALAWWGSAVVQAVAGVGVALLAVSYPLPLRRAERGVLVLPGALAAARFAVTVWVPLGGFLGLVAAAPFAPLTGVDPVAAEAFRWSQITRSVLLAGFTLALALWALRWQAGDARDRRQYALMTAALVLYPGVVAGSNAMAAPWYIVVVTLGPVLVLCALWLRNAARAEGREAALARNVALLCLVPVPVGMLLFDATTRTGGLGYGLFRSAGVAILAYAIVRHQMLGIDVKVRWTIKNSTIAGVFIGVFFVVSNSVQTYFQTTLGTYIGIVAAGALVFALAPLQHFADRVASAAMPGAKPAQEMSHPERAALYRDLARQAWADGHLTPDEHDLLETARERLGLSRDEAARIDREAARGGEARAEQVTGA
ncbi:MAG: hypothetical protein LC624_00430 [Halobacteriales archaeon]|nr:hypothetical protein [Halobacteriales archaeon]